MPRPSRKRKAAVLSWFSRKTRPGNSEANTEPDQLRSGSISTGHDRETELLEIVQPEDSIEGELSMHYKLVSTSIVFSYAFLDCRCEFAFGRFASDSTEDVTLPYIQRPTEVEESCELTVNEHSLAESYIMDIEDLALPEIPLLENALESIFPTISENDIFPWETNAHGFELAAAIHCTPELPIRYCDEEQLPEFPTTHDRCESSCVGQMFADTTPPSPMFRNNDDKIEDIPELDLSAAGSRIMNSAQLGDLSRSAIRMSPEYASGEIDNPVSPAPIVRFPSDELLESPISLVHSEVSSKRNGKIFVVILKYIGFQISPILILDGQLEDRDIHRNNKRLGSNLTRSKTTIISIPGLPPGGVTPLVLDCYCTACIKNATIAPQREIQVPKVRTPVSLEHKTESTEGKMMQIYATFDELQFPAANRRSECFVGTDAKESIPINPSASRRYTFSMMHISVHSFFMFVSRNGF